jgi:formamidopyrimidine-DNA glycosylase
LLITLDDNLELHFVDQRKFGKFYWAADEAEYARIAHVGPEPLADDFTPELLTIALAKSKTKIKARLLDQERIAGLGNIYVDESLFRAGIHPEREAGSLTKPEVERLWNGIRAALQAGLDNGGTTLRDYVDGTGRQGENQNYLLVYGKAGEPCPGCGGALVRTKVGGRGTVFCPVCQQRVSLWVLQAESPQAKAQCLPCSRN